MKLAIIAILLLSGVAQAQITSSASNTLNLVRYARLSNVEPERQATVCEEVEFVQLVRSAKALMQSRMQTLKSVLLQSPEDDMWTEVYGVWLKRKDIADSLRVSQYTRMREKKTLRTPYIWEVVTELHLSTSSGHTLGKVAEDLSRATRISEDGLSLVFVMPSTCR